MYLISFSRDFDLDAKDSDVVWAQFRFTTPDLARLKLALRIPDFIITVNRMRVPGLEALCILLRRLCYPCRLVDVGEEFNRSKSEIGIIFNHMIELVFTNFGHKLTTFNQPWLNLDVCAAAVAARGSPLPNCIGFIDGTLRAMAKPTDNQNACYNGHKRTHGLKYQGVMLPNGIIGHMFGQIEGKRHDAAMLEESGLLQAMEQIGDYCVYGDQAYPISPKLISPFRGVALTADQQAFNDAMVPLRLSIEWGFGEIIKFFALLDFKKNLKLQLQPISKYYLVGTILGNCHACVYGSNTSASFQLNPPALEEYLA